MKIYIPILLICSIITSTATAQEYSKLQPFFEKQLPSYKSWMKEIGLGKLMTLKNLRVRDDRITVYLILQPVNRDIAFSSWKQLVSDFSKENAISLQDRLFTKFSHTLGIPYEDLVMKITSKAIKEDGVPVVDGRIIYDEEKRSIISRGFKFRTDASKIIELPLFKIKKELFTFDNFDFPIDTLEMSKSNIYDRILKEAKVYFEGQPGAVEFQPGTLSPLTFEVKNIKAEVVPEKGFLIPNPYEKLNFTIAIHELGEKLILDCKIDGKYGSGIWLLKPSTPNNYTDMEPKYDEALKEYVSKKFQALIRSWLK